MKLDGRRIATLAAMVAVAFLSAIAIRGLVEPSNNNTAVTAQQQQQPMLKLEPTSGAPGGNVTITGNNFSMNSPVKVEFDGKMLNVGNITTTANGGFTVMANIPSDASDGGHEIKASDDKGKSASATFTVKKGG
ncbi:hypothetical protein NTE_01670 [Candidatus Nitrososphaera evergladensis SR1]|uniref:IPT/TIG domain-containing protein n=1 Tax=Candidatus Nitrososphaera evergladensis SR1 TaxID=1459636 RepID=A0A075MQC7_9ARCH|nr:IPT/TIG domain-containing protein [Candidatus Nitrososphaera evergladensis]AIF83731.1 hypothetical protein NTE_01670 [Candidatus Nitrososphaera evergladensis SR1]